MQKIFAIICNKCNKHLNNRTRFSRRASVTSYFNVVINIEFRSKLIQKLINTKIAAIKFVFTTINCTISYINMGQ